MSEANIASVRDPATLQATVEDKKQMLKQRIVDLLDLAAHPVHKIDDVTGKSFRAVRDPGLCWPTAMLDVVLDSVAGEGSGAIVYKGVRKERSAAGGTDLIEKTVAIKVRCPTALRF